MDEGASKRIISALDHQETYGLIESIPLFAPSAVFPAFAPPRRLLAVSGLSFAGSSMNNEVAYGLHKGKRLVNPTYLNGLFFATVPARWRALVSTIDSGH